LNLVSFIARRYFLLGRKLNFINIISILSMLVVTIVTTSIVVVLSFLNGMEDIIRQLYNTFDPDLKITPLTGKTFVADEALLQKVAKTEGVAYLTEVIEDNAIVSYKNQKDIVKIKGVSESFLSQHRLDSKMVAGRLVLQEQGVYYAVMGAGVQYKLSVALNDPFAPLNFYYPNRKKIKKPDAPDAFNVGSLRAGGVFAIEKQYDDFYVFVPLDFAQELLEYDDKRTSLEITVAPAYSIDRVQRSLQERLGSDFQVLNSDEQHVSILRAVRIEKLAVFLILTSLLAVSSVGIYFCLSMLTIRKQKDIAVLKSMGATSGFIKNIFVLEGLIIAFSGAFTGLLLGFAFCFLQEKFGMIGLGMETAIIKHYPVKTDWRDYIVTLVTVFLLTMAASYLPAQKASQITIKDNIK
jgi:lipoprotein-releasing system permease protein